MRDKLPVLFILILFFSCTHPEEIEQYKRLIEADSLLISRPDSAYHLLETYRGFDMNRKNKLYCNLLYTIASDKVDITFTDDSLISTTTHSNAFKYEAYNRYRAYLYHGIVRIRMNPRDSLGYYYLKHAEYFADKYVGKIPDNRYKQVLYYNMYIYNRLYKDYEKAEYYCLKEGKLCFTEEDRFINTADLYLIKDDLRDTLGMVELFGYLDSFQTPPDGYEDFLNSIRASHYYRHRDWERAIKYSLPLVAKREKEDKKVITSYFVLAKSYKEMNQLDSAMHYAHLCLDRNLRDTTERHYLLYAYHYNKFLGDLYVACGSFKEAAEYYEAAFPFHKRIVDKERRQSQLEIEKRFNIELYQKELENSKNSRLLMVLLVLILFLLLLIVLVIYWSRMKLHKGLAKINEERVKEMEILKEINDATLGNSVKLIKQMDKIVYSKGTKEEKQELYLDLLSKLKKRNRKKLSEIVENKRVRELFPVIDKLDNLSTTEKVVIICIKFGYTAGYTAKILDTTSESIRASKVRIRQKVHFSTNLSPEEKEQLLAILFSEK